MEKEGKVKVSRTSASAKNQNDINIRVVVGDQQRKKRVYRRKPKEAPAPAPAPVQNVVQLPPTTVAVPNTAPMGRPSYNFVRPRPYDSPDGAGTAVATFPELFQNYQARQEMMGLPSAATATYNNIGFGDGGFSDLTAREDGVGGDFNIAPTTGEQEIQTVPAETAEEGTQTFPEVPEEEQQVSELESDRILELMDAIPQDSFGRPARGYKTRYKQLLRDLRRALREEAGQLPERRGRPPSQSFPKLQTPAR